MRWPTSLFEGEGGDGGSHGGGSAPEPSLAVEITQGSAPTTETTTTETQATAFDWNPHLVPGRAAMKLSGIDGFPEDLRDFVKSSADGDGVVDFIKLAKRGKDGQAAARAKTEGVIKLPGEVPKEGATPEEMTAYQARVAEYHKALGVPETPDGYGLKAPENLPPGIAFNEEQAKDFAATAHKLGLPPNAVQELVNWKIQAEAKQQEQSQAALVEFKNKEIETLKQAFGDKTNERIADVAALLESVGFPKDQALYHPAFYHADTIKVLASLADKVRELSGEDRITQQPGSGESGQSFREQALALQKDPAYRTDKDMQARASELYRKAEAAGQI